MSEQDKSKIASLQDDHDPDISTLYRQSAQDMPPASLDDQILRAAHAAVTTQEEAPITPKPHRRWPWLGGLAASVLVAVLAVKLLPYSLRSPAPAMHEADSLEGWAADRLAPKAVTPSVPENYDTGVPAGLPEKRLLKDETSTSRALEQSRASESAAPSTGLQGQIETGIATQNRDNEFINIVMLWERGDTTEALKRFEIFQKAYPGYLPHPRHQDTFQALQSAVSTHNAK